MKNFKNMVQLYVFYGIPHDLQQLLKSRICKSFIIKNLYKTIQNVKNDDLLASGCVQIMSK